MTKKKNNIKNELEELSPDELVEKSKELTEFLTSLENDYRNAAISEESYKHTKEINIKKLDEINSQLKDFGISVPEIKKKDKNEQKPTNIQSTQPKNAASIEQTQQSPQLKSLETSSNTIKEPSKDIPEENNIVDSDDSSVSDSSIKKISFMDKIKQRIMPSNNASLEVQKQPIKQNMIYGAPNFEVEMGKFSEKFSVELERVKATIDAIKETKSATDERLQNLIEGLAELRSTVFQKEATFKEQELKLAKLKELVDGVEPQKINKEFLKRDKFNSEIETRTEKLEIKMKDMIKTVGEINELLKSIGGLENIANVDREISKKMEEMHEKEKSVERIFSKIEKIFVDINKKLGKFDMYEVKQENINEILDDVVKNVDSFGVKFENYIDKKEITKYQERLDLMQNDMNNMMRILKKAVPFAESEIPKELQELVNKKEDIETLLSNVKCEYELKHISDEDYKKIKSKNEIALEKIRKNISELMNTITNKNSKNTKTENIISNEKESEIKHDDLSESLKKIETTKDESVNIAADNLVKDKETVEEQLKNISVNIEVGQNKLDADKSETSETKNNNSKSIENEEIKTDSKIDDIKDENNSIPKIENESDQIKKPINDAEIIKTKELKAENIGEKNTKISDENNPLIEELNESLKEGLISKDTYEKTKKLLIG